MLPPGLAFAAVSDKAWEFNKNSKLPKFYFNWAKERANLEKNQTNFTPAISLIIGLRESLRMIKAGRARECVQEDRRVLPRQPGQVRRLWD